MPIPESGRRRSQVSLKTVFQGAVKLALETVLDEVVRDLIVPLAASGVPHCHLMRQERTDRFLAGSKRGMVGGSSFPARAKTALERGSKNPQEESEKRNRRQGALPVSESEHLREVLCFTSDVRMTCYGAIRRRGRGQTAG